MIIMPDNISAEEETSTKRRKLSEEERLHRCRERNRIHAKNTRERKKNMIEATQQRFITLHEEKARLSKLLLDTTVAGILISLSSKANTGSSTDSNGDGTSGDDSSSKNSSLMTFEEIKNNCIHEMSDNEFDEDDNELDIQSFNTLKKDRSECTPEELEILRRERNRVHAKKTRLKKKKILLEMESSVAKLHNEVCELRKRYKVSQQIEKVDFTSCTKKSPRNDSLTNSPCNPSNSVSTTNTTYTLDDIAIHGNSDDEETINIKSEIRKTEEGSNSPRECSQNNNGYHNNRPSNYDNNHMIYNNEGFRRQPHMDFNRPNFLRVRPPPTLPGPHPGIPILSSHHPSYNLSDRPINYRNEYNQHMWGPYSSTLQPVATASYSSHHPNYFHFNPPSGSSTLRPYFEMSHARPPRYSSNMMTQQHPHPPSSTNYTYNTINSISIKNPNHNNNKRSNSECNNNSSSSNIDKELLSILPFGAEVEMSALGL